MGRFLPVTMLLAASVLVLAGCGWKPGPIQHLGEADPAGQVNALDEGAWRCVAVNLVRSSRASGRLEVSLELVNRGTAACTVEVGTRFLDEQGIPVDAAQVWERMLFEGGQSLIYTATSVSEAATRYRVELRSL